VGKNILGGRYRVTEKIGTGGMADVYKAIDETLGRSVAVKVMHPKYASDPSFTDRFKQEAQAAANLQSPNIVNIYDWGQEGTYYYIVMEYVRGTDLKSIIRQKGALSSRQAATIGAQVCSALSVAHGYDVIHRDIKPHNIMVTPDGMVKVMDFGIARAGNTTMTQTGSVLGTAHYVSPEQAQGRDLTNASDLYSLGIVLYESVTGKVPFDADTPVAVALKQVNEQAQRPSRLSPGIDPRLEEIIGRAMSKDPRMRYATADEMRKDLQRIADDTDQNDATTVLAGAAMGAAGAAGISGDDKTTVLPGLPQEDSTTVMPTVGGDSKLGGQRPSDAVLQNQNVGKTKSAGAKWGTAFIFILALLIIGGALAYAYYVFNPSIAGVEVPDVVNKPQIEAEALIKEAGFKVGEPVEKHDPEVEKGKVISQNPKGGSRAEEGSTVILTISLGVEMGTVPDIVNMTEVEAKKALKDAGFEADPQPAIHSTEVGPGKVISQDPVAGSELEKGSKVSYMPSMGAETREVPDVRNQDSVTAEANLIAAGFAVAVVEDYSDTVGAGVVISQNPNAGTKVEKGTTVTITKSLGKKIVEKTVPNVIGLRLDTAQTIISNEGLYWSVTYKKTNNTGNVVAQSVAGGTKVPEKTNINLTVDADAP
jgi:serine/threonine-protein kinase